MANQLRSLLESCWPGAAAIFADVDSPIALAFVRRYPTAASADRLGEKRLASFLAQHRYCGRRTPAELLQRLRAASLPRIGEIEAEAKGQLAVMLVSILEQLVARLQELTSRIEHEVAELPEGRIVMSLPRSGRVNAAQILAELGDQRARFDSAEHLAAEAGVVPVTHASGKQRGVVFRWACNHRLRSAITTFADNSRHSSPWAAGVYQRARARGCDHPHATRILARAWVRVLFRMWQTGETYDVSRHRPAASIAATA
jgi:transposase